MILKTSCRVNKKETTWCTVKIDTEAEPDENNAQFRGKTSYKSLNIRKFYFKSIEVLWSWDN